MATQTLFRATATASALDSDLDHSSHVAGGIDPRDRAREAVRNPDRPNADRDLGGPVANGNLGSRISPVFRLSLDEVLVSLLATQTAPSPNATAPGFDPAGNPASTFPSLARSLLTVWSLVFATYTCPFPAAIPVGPFPTGIVLTTSRGPGADLGNRSRRGVRYPDQATRDCDPAGRAFDRNPVAHGVRLWIDDDDRAAAALATQV